MTSLYDPLWVSSMKQKKQKRAFADTVLCAAFLQAVWLWWCHWMSWHHPVWLLRLCPKKQFCHIMHITCPFDRHWLLSSEWAVFHKPLSSSCDVDCWRQLWCFSLKALSMMEKPDSTALSLNMGVTFVASWQSLMRTSLLRQRKKNARFFDNGVSAKLAGPIGSVWFTLDPQVNHGHRKCQSSDRRAMTGSCGLTAACPSGWRRPWWPWC